MVQGGFETSAALDVVCGQGVLVGSYSDCGCGSIVVVVRDDKVCATLVVFCFVPPPPPPPPPSGLRC